MKKFTIQNISFMINSKDKINILSLENKDNKYILYSNSNSLSDIIIDNNIFTKFEWNENFQIMPKKKMNELFFTINTNNNIYSLLWNNNPVYYLKNSKNIHINNNILKLILSNGLLYYNNTLSKEKNIIDNILQNKNTDVFKSVHFSVNKIDSDKELPTSNIENEDLPISNIENEDLPISNIENEDLPISNIENEDLPTSNIENEDLPTSNIENEDKIDSDNNITSLEKIKTITNIINEEKIELSNKKTEMENNVFNLENVLMDFNKLFQSIHHNDLNQKDIQQIEPQKIQLKSNEIKNKIIHKYYISKIQYLNIFYKLITIKLEYSNELNFLNLYQSSIIENNIINKSNISFELNNNNSSYLILFFNQKYLINKINNTIIVTSLSNKKSQLIKNKENFKLGNYDYMLYNDGCILIPMINKKIYDNNYGTSYNLYIPYGTTI